MVAMDSQLSDCYLTSPNIKPNTSPGSENVQFILQSIVYIYFLSFSFSFTSSEIWNFLIILIIIILVVVYISDNKFSGSLLRELQYICMYYITRQGNTWGLHFGITPGDQPGILIPISGSWTNISSISDCTSSNNI